MNLQNPVKAIYAHCLECSCGSRTEVVQCQVFSCTLHPFRLGKNPYRKPVHRTITEEQKQQYTRGLKEWREAQKKRDEK